MVSSSKARAAISRDSVLEHLSTIFGDDVHAKRVLSLANATAGALHAGALGVHGIGRGIAAVTGGAAKHGVKQADRLLGNSGLDMEVLLTAWVAHVVGESTDLYVNMDWTEFDKDDHSMLVIAAQTGHGRSVPLVWKTFRKSELAEQRNDHEDEVLGLLRRAIPEGIRVTVIADRGFGDQKLYHHLRADLGFDYIIRFRSNILVTNEDGEARPAGKWVGKGGRMKVLRNAAVTADRYPVPMVICVKDPGMKDIWCLATSRDDLTGAVIKALYGKRFTIEESFRDTKDLRFGMGMSWNRISSPDRRDRMLLIGVLAQSLLTLLGHAGELLGMDRLLKANTVKRRTLSLLRQGLCWYDQIPNMPDHRLLPLMEQFGKLLLERRFFQLALEPK